MRAHSLFFLICLFYCTPGAANEPDSFPCLEQLVGAGAVSEPVVWIGLFRPTQYAIPTQQQRELDPEWMFNVNAVAKTFVKAFHWQNSPYAVALYGRPYWERGAWRVDFYCQDFAVPGERLLWQMPAKTFFEGVGQPSRDWD